MKDILRLEPTHGFEEGAEFVYNDYKLIISVAEEKAVGSYNQSFECYFNATHEQAIELRNWLVSKFPP